METDSLLVVEARVTQEVNDQGQMEPALKALGELPQDLGRPQAMLADNGYFSGDNVEHCVDEEITPYIAVDREKHHVTIQERAAEPEPPSEPADAVEQMKHRLKTTQGRALYGQRKATVETRVRHHQIGDGVSAVPAPGPEGGGRGMDAGEPGLEPETYA